jgi:hypothetical protein
MPNVTVGEALGQSFRFIGTAWRRAWGIMLISVWLAGTLQAIQGLRPEWIGFVVPLSLLLNAIVGTAVIGALFRIGIEPFHSGDPAFQAAPTGLQWGGLEFRVLGSNILIGVIFGGVAVVFAIVWLIIFSVMAQGDSANLSALEGSNSAASGQALLHILAGPAGIVSMVLFLVLAVGFFYFAARLLVFNLLAADTGSFSLARAWAMTRGAVTPIILTLIIFGLLQGLVYLIGLIVLGGAAASGQGVFWGAVVISVVTGAIIAPLSIGLQIYVYNARRSGDAGIAATFS